MFRSILATVLALPISCWAQDAGVYVGGSFGWSKHRDACDMLGAVQSCDDSDRTWKLFLGYQANRYLSAELGYADLGRTSITATSQTSLGGTGTTDTRTKANAWELVSVGSLPVVGGGSLLGRAGVYRSDVKKETANTGFPSFVPRSQEVRAHNYGLTFGLGAKYQIARGLAVRLEFQRYFGVGDDDAGIAEKDIDTLSAGLLYRF
jgi:opacity protein-like surface antigen